MSYETTPSPRFRAALPQLEGGIFLTDAGLETDLIFNRGIPIREFAAHTLFDEPGGAQALADYFRGFLDLARECDTGFILDSQTWKAHPHWAADLGASLEELRRANETSLRFISGLRDELHHARPIVLNAVVGPRGDAYTSTGEMSPDAAEDYHSTQLGWLAQTEADMVTALTFTSAQEAIGFVRAAHLVGLPAVVSFTVETDGRLPTGQPLGEAVEVVDDATAGLAQYFMVNCAHPDHFASTLEGPWTRRIRGIRCNASRRSHAELDEAETLDPGDPEELGALHRALVARLPRLNVFGGCCGSDLRHVAQIARTVLSGATRNRSPAAVG